VPLESIDYVPTNRCSQDDVVDYPITPLMAIAPSSVPSALAPMHANAAAPVQANPVAHAALGVAIAVHADLSLPQTEPPVPLFDEGVHPLGGVAMDGSAQALLNFVLTLAQQLAMDAEQLVVAMVLFESTLRAKPGSLRLQCTRPLLLASAVVAVKVTLDEITMLPQIRTQLGTLMPMLTSHHLMRLEASLLMTLG
jgi:hypothetical protein